IPETELRHSLKPIQASTQEYYCDYATKKGVDRNSLVRNSEVLFQSLGRDAAMVRALRSINPHPQSARVLDVGCGDGDSLWLFLRLGFEPSNLFGVDVQEDRILKAKKTKPTLQF